MAAQARKAALRAATTGTSRAQPRPANASPQPATEQVHVAPKPRRRRILATSRAPVMVPSAPAAMTVPTVPSSCPRSYVRW